MISVPGAAKLISEFAYHRYDTRANDALPEIAKRARAHGLPTAMLEHVAGDVVELHADLTIANASAWQQYGIAVNLGPKGKDRGAGYLVRDFGGRGGPTIKMGERTRGLAQYFRFVRAGAVRIGATSNTPDVLPVAFRNQDGSDVVVARSTKAGTIKVVGVPGGTYGMRYTTDLDTGRELPAVTVAAGQPLFATLPAPGIVTIYRKKVP
jgi:hypothetical protein